MTISKSYFYGGGQTISSAVEVPIHHAGGRFYTITMTAASQQVKLPDAQDEPYTGWAVYSVVNLGANTFDIVDQDDNVIHAALAQNEMCRIALLDKSTAAGSWRCRVEATNSATVAGADFLVIMGGTKSGSDNGNQRYDPNNGTWSAGTNTPNSTTESVCWRSSNRGYMHGGSTGMEEYVIDSYVTKMNANFSQGGSGVNQGGMEENNKCVALHGGAASVGDTPSEVEEWDQTDNWTIIASPFGQTWNSCTGCETGVGTPNVGWVYVGQGLGGFDENNWKEHSNTGDSWTARTEIMDIPVNSADWANTDTTLFAMEELRMHSAGGQTTSSTDNDWHRAYTIATDSWAVAQQLPAVTSETAGNTFSNVLTRALLACGRWDGGGSEADRAYDWNDITEVFVRVDDAIYETGDVNNSMCIVEKT